MNAEQTMWHPCSQMKDYESFKPLAIARAEGSYIELTNGKKIIDATSSWWCKSLGHQHPRLKGALLKQLTRFEHVIFANSTNDVIEMLSYQLTQLSPTLKKVFYASEGSSAVEIALKMSLHARQLTGEFQRSQFISLKNAYHGETVGAMSVSDCGLYRKPYESMLFTADIISAIPYVAHTSDTLWTDCSVMWSQTEKQLQPYADTATAIILEPILQGAGGMCIYSQDFLKRLRAWATQHHVHVIADEILTGIGRTGKMLACEHAGIEPDFLCLGKGLTSGWMPFSAVLTTNKIYDYFYADYESGKSFLHSHTFSGHVLGASVASEVLNIMHEEKISERANQIGDTMYQHMLDIAHQTKKLTNIRSIGAMVAADLISDQQERRLGYEVFQKAVQLGAWLRPLGNTIYWMPPLTTEAHTLAELKEITQHAILC
jgi:adenosylmethionine-8-amino-7-oxononanoate aminotransferase